MTAYCFCYAIVLISTHRRVRGKVVIVTGNTLPADHHPVHPEKKLTIFPSAGTNSPIGIGRASAHQFAANGAKAIYICDYITEHLATHARELKELYPLVEVHVREMDAGNEENVESVVNDAVAKYGRLDIFFANAGVVGSHQRITDASGEDFMEVMKTNALG